MWDVHCTIDVEQTKQDPFSIGCPLNDEGPLPCVCVINEIHTHYCYCYGLRCSGQHPASPSAGVPGGSRALLHIEESETFEPTCQGRPSIVLFAGGQLRQHTWRVDPLINSLITFGVYKCAHTCL